MGWVEMGWIKIFSTLTCFILFSFLNYVSLLHIQNEIIILKLKKEHLA